MPGPPELALHAPDRARLSALNPTSTLGELPGVMASRLHFGVEFCEHLLPSAEDCSAAAHWAKERGWAFTLHTPYVVDARLASVEAIVDASLDAFGATIEVIVADWGVLRRLRDRFGPRVRFGLSRLLNRAQRDPRVVDTGPEHLGGDARPDSWGRASHDQAAFRRFAAAQGLAVLCTDVPMQGFGPPVLFGASDPGLVVHLPWGAIASGRLCMVSGLGKPPSVRFTPPPACDAPCRQTLLGLTPPWGPREEGVGGDPLPDGFVSFDSFSRRRSRPALRPDHPTLWRRGNTDFHRLEGPSLGAAFHWARSHPRVERIVWEPGVPM